MQTLKLEGVTWHTFRHTFTSRLAMSGQAEGTMAARLRQSTTGLVRRYAHLSPTYLKAAVEAVASFGKPMLAQLEPTHMKDEEPTISNGTVTVESIEEGES